uniref:Calcium-binding protein n=1 Tax=Lepeophtheirus salmonis TaxID=72036 RepID=A0A0K2UTQ2_LEPSM
MGFWVVTDMTVGGDGGDMIVGGLGGDMIIGGEGGDMIVGGKGGDMIVGGEGGDMIVGGDGGDIIAPGGAGGPTKFGELNVEDTKLRVGWLKNVDDGRGGGMGNDGNELDWD